MAKLKQLLHRIASLAPAAAGLTVSLFALVTNAATAPTNIITKSDDVVNLLCAGLAWMFWLLIVVAIAMFFIGGYTYATSRGNSEKVSQATKTLTYAAIAVVVAIIAKGVPLLIASFIGGVDPSTLQACG